MEASCHDTWRRAPVAAGRHHYKAPPPAAIMLLLVGLSALELVLAAAPHYYHQPSPYEQHAERRLGIGGPGSQVAVSVERVKDPDQYRKKRFPVMWLRNQYPFNKYYGGKKQKKAEKYSVNGNNKYAEAMMGQYSEQVETLDPNPSSWVRIPDRPTATIKVSKQPMNSFQAPRGPPPSLAGATEYLLEPMMAPQYLAPSRYMSQVESRRPLPQPMMTSESQQSDYAQPAAAAAPAEPAQQGFGGISLSFGSGRSISFGGGQGLTIGGKAGAISIGGKNGDNQPSASAYSETTKGGSSSYQAPAYGSGGGSGGGGGSYGSGGGGGGYGDSYVNKHPTMSMDFPRNGKKLIHVNLDNAPTKVRAHMSPRVKITTGSRDPLEKPSDDELSEGEEDIFEAPEPFEKKNATAAMNETSALNMTNTLSNGTDTTPMPLDAFSGAKDAKYPQQSDYNYNNYQQQFHYQQKQHHEEAYHYQQQQQQQQLDVGQPPVGYPQQQQQPPPPPPPPPRQPIFDEPPHYQRPPPNVYPQFQQQQQPTNFGPQMKQPLPPPVQTYRPHQPPFPNQPPMMSQQPITEHQKLPPPPPPQNPMIQPMEQPIGGEQPPMAPQQPPPSDERPAVNQWRQFSGQARQQMSRAVPKQQDLNADQNPRFYNGGHPNSIVDPSQPPVLEGKEMVEVSASDKVGSYARVGAADANQHFVPMMSNRQQQLPMIVNRPQHPQFGPNTVYQVANNNNNNNEPVASKTSPQAATKANVNKPQAPTPAPGTQQVAQESNYQPAYGGNQNDGTKTYTFGNGGISSYYGNGGGSSHEPQPGSQWSDGFDQKHYQAKVEKFDPEAHDKRERSKIVFFLKPRISIHMANSSTTTKRPKNEQRLVHVINKPIFLNNTRNGTHEDEDFLDPDLKEPMEIGYGYGYGAYGGGYGNGYGNGGGGYAKKSSSSTTKKPKPKTTTTTTTTTVSPTDESTTPSSDSTTTTTTTAPSTATSEDSSSSSTTTASSTTVEGGPSSTSSESPSSTTTEAPATTTTTTTEAPVASSTPEATTEAVSDEPEDRSPASPTPPTLVSVVEVTGDQVERENLSTTSSTRAPLDEAEADLVGAATESAESVAPTEAPTTSTTTTMRSPMRRTTRATKSSAPFARRTTSTTSTSTSTSTSTTTTTTAAAAASTSTEAPPTTPEAMALEMITTMAPIFQQAETTTAAPLTSTTSTTSAAPLISTPTPTPTTTTTTTTSTTPAPTTSTTSSASTSTASESSSTDDSEEIVEVQNPRKRSTKAATMAPTKTAPGKQQQPMLLNPELINKLMGNRTLVSLMSSQLKRVVDTETMGDEEKRRIVRQVFEQMMEDKVDFSMNNVRLAVKTVSSSYRAAAEKQRKRAADSGPTTGARRPSDSSFSRPARVKSESLTREEFGTRRTTESSKSLSVIETAMRLTKSAKGPSERPSRSAEAGAKKTDASGNPIVVVLLPQEKRA